jgi:hypothetical protein
VTKYGNFEFYKKFELYPRQEPIPKEILEMLELIIETANDRGYLKNSLDMFLYIPEYEEIKELIESEEFADEDEGEDTQNISIKERGSALRQRLKQKEEEFSEGVTHEMGKTWARQMSVDEVFAEIELQCAGIHDELIAMSGIEFKAWCKRNHYQVALEFDLQIEAVDAIIQDIRGKLTEEVCKELDI